MAYIELHQIFTQAAKFSGRSHGQRLCELDTKVHWIHSSKISDIINNALLINYIELL